MLHHLEDDARRIQSMSALIRTFYHYHWDHIVKVLSSYETGTDQAKRPSY